MHGVVQDCACPPCRPFSSASGHATRSAQQQQAPASMRSSPSTRLPRTYSAALDGCRPSTSIRRSLTSPNVVVAADRHWSPPLACALALALSCEQEQASPVTPFGERSVASVRPKTSTAMRYCEQSCFKQRLQLSESTGGQASAAANPICGTAQQSTDEHGNRRT